MLHYFVCLKKRRKCPLRMMFHIKANIANEYEETNNTIMKHVKVEPDLLNQDLLLTLAASSTTFDPKYSFRHRS